MHLPATQQGASFSMPIFSITLRRAFCVFLIFVAALRAQEGAPVSAQPSANEAPPAKIEPAKNPLNLPAGVARAGWETLLKNDFPGAEAAFNKALAAEPNNLEALEGLRAAAIATGNYKEAQRINLRMVEACTEPGLVVIFIQRAIDILSFVDSRAEVLATFTKAAATAPALIATHLKDHCAGLLESAEKPAEARQLLASLGYVDKWQFATGPFGAEDKGDVLEKHFAPERALKSLEFKDETGKPVPVLKDLEAPSRSLNLDLLFPGTSGVFYAFTNLQSEREQEIILAVTTSEAYRVYLRGMPIIKEPGEEQFRRYGTDLVRVRLQAGANPLLVKLGGPVSLSVYVSAPDFAPAPGVRALNLPEAALAAHEVSPVRGFLLAEKACGMSATYFLNHFQQASGLNPTQTLRALAESGALTFPEAYWLDFALSRENDPRAREALARVLAGSAPDAVNVLDMAAYILQSAGEALGNTESREVEEAIRWREHALTVVPDSHQHLFALYEFYNQHQLEDQALQKIKACVAAHPDSSAAQVELGKMYLHKRFMTEAEQCFEKAAQLDNACLATLVWFHEYSGDRSKTKELRQKLIQLGLLNRNAQFEHAMSIADFNTAEELLKQLEKDYPERVDEWNGLRVRLLSEKGSLKQAFKLQKKIYQAQPSAHFSKRATLLALVNLALRVNEDGEAKDFLRGYLADSPGDYECRRRLQDLEKKQTPHWWEAYDVKTEGVDSTPFTNEKYPDANHAWIVDFMVTKILPDLSQESYVHIAQKVLNNQGIQELSELLVQAQRNEIIFIRTLNPDGSSYLPQNVHNFNLAQTASLYKVVPGSILEHAYLVHADAAKEEPELNMAFNFNAIESQRAISRWVVLLSDEAKAKLKIRKICPEMVDEQILDGPPGYTVYQWTNKQVEGIKKEKYMPQEADQEVIPLVLLETTPPPYHAGNLLTQRQSAFIPPEAAVQAAELLAKLPAGANEGAKFMALLQWVRDNIQPGTRSKTLDDVWFDKTGNAWQCATLALKMAQSAGLKANLAGVNENYLPGKIWRSKNAPRQWDPWQWATFGSQMLVLQEEHAPSRWFQFMGDKPKYYNLEDFQPNQPGSLAVIYTDAGPRFKLVNGERLGAAPLTQILEAALDAEGRAHIKAAIELFGKQAGDFRESLADPRLRTRIEEGIARSSWPAVQSPTVEIKGGEQAGPPVSISYTGTVESLATREENSLFLAPFPQPLGLLTLFGTPERQHDLLLKNEFSELDNSIAYTCPEGYAWTEAPDGIFLATEFGYFMANYSVRGRVLTCTRSFLLPAQRIQTDKYPALQDFLKQVAENQQQRIAYAPLRRESFGGHLQEILSTGYAGNEGKDKLIQSTSSKSKKKKR
jgi:tetratricopeptide (TPR) repeat protein